MNKLVKLTIDSPSGDSPLVEYGRDFDVQGRIYGGFSLPDNCSLTVRLLDSSGALLRYAAQHRKNNSSLFTAHPDLTAYPDDIDPGMKRLVSFGFPELLVKDIRDPEASLHDASIKCWYSDTSFKAVIVSATGTRQGRIFDDGVGFFDENGKPFNMLGMGCYTVEAELDSPEGEVLAIVRKNIRIGSSDDQAIVRFNPPEHKKNMVKWCRDIGVSISSEPLPGYLDPYAGIWLYHMGLLPMYRSNDIALYATARVHMFVYLIDPASTSYETELAYLQTQRAVGDPRRFFAYHYDIGEALIRKGTPFEQHGRIVGFEKDEYLAVCRVDIVSSKASENHFDLSESGVIDMLTDMEDLTVPAGSVIAIMGVVRPWQLDPRSFRLRRDNTYEITDSVNELHYELSTGSEVIRESRRLMLERYDGKPIGSSVFEFYNLFRIPEEWRGHSISVRLTPCDNSGEKRTAAKLLCIRVKAE